MEGSRVRGGDTIAFAWTEIAILRTYYRCATWFFKRTSDGKSSAYKSEGCLGETLLAKSGMTVEQLGKLNRKVQALRDAVAR
jgi:hypothetical protein